MDKYCKVEKGSDLYESLKNLSKRIVECQEAREKLTLQYSNTTEYCRSENPYIFYGGIGAFVFRQEPDVKVWKKIINVIQTKDTIDKYKMTL